MAADEVLAASMVKLSVIAHFRGRPPWAARRMTSAMAARTAAAVAAWVAGDAGVWRRPASRRDDPGGHGGGAPSRSSASVPPAAITIGQACDFGHPERPGTSVMAAPDFLGV